MSKNIRIPDGLYLAVSQYSDQWISLILFLYAFSLRFAFKSAGFLHMDSVGYAYLGELTYKTMSLHYANFPGHPGVVLINATFYGILQLFGFDSEFTTIFVSVLFGALAAPFIYLICIRLGFSRIYALCAGIIMIFFPLQWSLSEYMPTDVESLFFLLAAFYFALKTGRISLYLSSFLFMFSIAIKFENIFLLPFYICICYINLQQVHEKEYRTPRIPREIILAILIIAIGLVLLYVPYFPGALGVIDDPGRIALVQVKTLSWQLVDAFKLLLTAFSLIGVILIIIGIAGIFGKKNVGKEELYNRRIMFVLLIISIFSILFSASIPLKDYDRYILAGFSILIIFTAYGLRMLEYIDKRIPTVIMIFLIIYMVDFTVPIVSARHEWSGQKDFAKNLRSLVGEDAVIIAMEEGALINYYSNLTVIKSDINKTEGLMKQNISVYIVSSVLPYVHGKDTNNMDFLEEFNKSFEFRMVGAFHNEDWHGRVLSRNVFIERIYRIEYKRD